MPTLGNDRRVRLPLAFLLGAVAGLGVGGILWLAGAHDGADAAWAATTVFGLLPSAVWVALSVRRREPGVDVLALLALAGALAVGEVLAVDGRIEGVAEAVFDESALTGEALPVRRPVGDAVRSGVVNAGAPLDLRATASAAESTYARIIRLVESARRQRARRCPTMVTKPCIVSAERG